MPGSLLRKNLLSAARKSSPGLSGLDEALRGAAPANDCVRMAGLLGLMLLPTAGLLAQAVALGGLAETLSDVCSPEALSVQSTSFPFSSYMCRICIMV